MIIPLNNYILVEPEFREELTKSGIYLKYSQKLQSPPNVGTVTHIDGEADVNVGDRVIFKPTETQNPKGFKHEGKSYIYLKSEQILGVIKT